MGIIRTDSFVGIIFSCYKEYDQKAAGEILPPVQDRFLRYKTSKIGDEEKRGKDEEESDSEQYSSFSIFSRT